MIAFVLGLALLLLLVAFRSLKLALAVMGLNLLSIGATYGILVSAFQHTWAEGLLGFESNGTVTSAAIVMVAVFAVFATLRLLDMKHFGFGLAAAVLLDATLVRCVALPAAVALLGDRGWRVRRRAPAAERSQWDHGRPVAAAAGSSHGTS